MADKFKEFFANAAALFSGAAETIASGANTLVSSANATASEAAAAVAAGADTAISSAKSLFGLRLAEVRAIAPPPAHKHNDKEHKAIKKRKRARKKETP